MGSPAPQGPSHTMLSAAALRPHCNQSSKLASLKKIDVKNVLTLCAYVYSLIIKHHKLIDKGHSIHLKLIDSTMEIGSLPSSWCD